MVLNEEGFERERETMDELVHQDESLHPGRDRQTDRLREL
jgi:hypothetical protein